MGAGDLIDAVHSPPIWNQKLRKYQDRYFVFELWTEVATGFNIHTVLRTNSRSQTISSVPTTNCEVL